MMKVFLWVLTGRSRCHLEKNNGSVMLCLKNRSKHLPNCLNTPCSHEVSISVIICHCVECWHLDVPANRTTGLSPRRLEEEECFQLWFSRPLLLRAGCYREPFLTPHRVQATFRGKTQRKHCGPMHTTLGSGSFLRNSDALKTKKCYPDE